MKILVTGATGFIGSHLVKKLCEEGHEVRILVRVTGNIDFFKNMKVEIVRGDLGEKGSLINLLENIDAVIHAAACTGGTWNDHYHSTILGTENILEMATKCKIKKFIHISSIAVYDINMVKKNGLITEDTPIERYPEKVGPYAKAKIQSEHIVNEYKNKQKFSTVIIRPGLVYGPRGSHPFFPHLGALLFNKFLIRIGSGKDLLPLTYVGNVVDGILKTLEDKRADGFKYNIVDQIKINKKQYIENYIKTFRLRPIVIPLPYRILMCIAFSFEMLGKIPLFKKFAGVTRYSLAAKFKPVIVDGSKIIRQLDWTPKYKIDESIDNYFNYSKGKYIF